MYLMAGKEYNYYCTVYKFPPLLTTRKFCNLKDIECICQE
jgi:hypothetical protein